ncbi:MAG TPA: ComEC/Rec2 family competence protein [Bdellovibrionales bacterium]|nr:ComEC/Rec2 family competence protein [Bdellovibrionales bacterium]
MIAPRLGMLAFIGFSAIAALLVKTLLPDFSASLIEPLHQQCLSSCPQSRHFEMYAAIVCGSSLESDFTRDAFARTGLIHLLVVSGSHLVFLEDLLRLILPVRRFPRSSSAAIGLVLIGFALVTRLQPPVLRACFAWLAGVVSETFILNWSRLVVLSVSGASTLFFCRTRGEVLSLGLSWAASMALHLVSIHRRTGSVSLWLKTHITAYSLLWIPLATITVAHPVSILCNLLLGPIIGLVLFPVSVTAIIVPIVSTISDVLWDITLFVVNATAELLPALRSPGTMPASWIILYVGIASIGLFYRERSRNR